MCGVLYVECVVREVNWLTFSVSSFDNIHAGAFRPFKIGRIGCLGFCIFMRALILGTEGFRFMYFHLESCGLSVLLWFTVFLIRFWKIFVGSVLIV